MSLAKPGSVDNRSEPRYNVSWRARMDLPNGQTVDARVRDISENGLGLTCDQSIQNGVVLSLLVGMPDLNDPSRLLAIPGKLRVAFVVMQGHDFKVGGRWAEMAPSAQEFWRHWVHKIRNGG